MNKKQLQHTAREVVEAVTRGLRRGKADFGVDSRQILVMICGLPQYNWELLELGDLII